MSEIGGVITLFFYGIGGQGVLSAAEVLARAAALEGYHVKKSETRGMAKRGGEVESFVRFGKKVYSPIAPLKAADFLICLDAGRPRRGKSALKPGGKDMTRLLSKAEEANIPLRFLNSFILGALSSHLDIGEENFKIALEEVFKGRSVRENKKYFKAGRKAEGAIFKRTIRRAENA